jgi:hypothetical protein
MKGTFVDAGGRVVGIQLSGLVEAIDRLGKAQPIELATVEERDDLVTLLRSLEVLIPVAQAGLSWCNVGRVPATPQEEKAETDLLDALVNVHR